MSRVTSVKHKRAIGMLHACDPIGNSPTISMPSFRQTETMSNRSRPGCPRVTTRGQDHHIRLYHLHSRFRTATMTAWTTAGTQNPRIRAQTLRNRLREIVIKVIKRAKIRNRYKQSPHLTQDTNGKVTNSQLDITNESQEVSPFPVGDHKVHVSINRRARKHIKKQDRNNRIDPQKKRRLGTVR